MSVISDLTKLGPVYERGRARNMITFVRVMSIGQIGPWEIKGPKGQ